MLLLVPVAFGTGSYRMKGHSWSGSDLSRGIVARVGVIVVLKHRLDCLTDLTDNFQVGVLHSHLLR
jgi:hypothetical protein